MIRIGFNRERKAQNNPEIYAPIEKSNKSFLQAVAISCKTPFSKPERYVTIWYRCYYDWDRLANGK
jgi:hypothetical protein